MYSWISELVLGSIWIRKAHFGNHWHSHK